MYIINEILISLYLPSCEAHGKNKKMCRFVIISALRWTYIVLYLCERESRCMPIALYRYIQQQLYPAIRPMTTSFISLADASWYTNPSIFPVTESNMRISLA